MEHSHDGCEHFRGHILVDLTVSLKVDGLTGPKNMLCESSDFFLIVLASEEGLFRRVVEAFSGSSHLL